MAIRRWDPWHDLIAMQSELNKLFERTFSSEERGVARAAVWAPAIDMFDRNNAVIVRAELPGVKAEDVDISIIDNKLVVKGERKFKEEIKEENYYRIEQRYGSFERIVQLPAKVDVGNVEAVYAEGVLEINLPKAEEERPKQIKIKAVEGK
ncbi:MAG TPA: Hsp20/alpha crystallin family protein [Anaerolineae bacterium]|nr:Hsp20/alpha crystallin family protein [Anaerolineae bacterium]